MEGIEDLGDQIVDLDASWELDDEDRSAEDLRPAQHPNSRIVSEIIENEAALSLFGIIGNHDGRAGIASAKRLNA